MVAKCVNDLARDTQCENFVACSVVIDKGADVRDIAQVAFFYVSEEIHLVVPTKENQVLMEFFLNQ